MYFVASVLSLLFVYFCAVLFYILCLIVMMLNKYRIITNYSTLTNYNSFFQIASPSLNLRQFNSKRSLYSLILKISLWDLGTIGFIEVSRNSFSLFLSQLPKFSINLSPQVHIFPALRRFFFLSHPSPLPSPPPSHSPYLSSSQEGLPSL